MIDAEHSYFQPAIDNTVAMLQTKFNRCGRGRSGVIGVGWGWVVG